jgi:biopolymer transport protein ExbD
MSRIRIRSRRHVVGELPQASLADVAFLLLIFFISTAIFEVHRALPFSLPRRDAAATTVTPEEVVRILLADSGQLIVDGQGTSVQDLGAYLERKVHERPSLVVVIETSPTSTYGHLVSIFDALEGAGTRRVHLRARES